MKQLSQSQLLVRILALPINIKLGRKKPVRDMHSSSVGTIVDYGRKKLDDIGPR
jgi:hypothetical protein